VRGRAFGDLFRGHAGVEMFLLASDEDVEAAGLGKESQAAN
jgi:hypothetical protein